MTAPDVRAQAANLIDAAIDVLHERGWCQHQTVDDTGRVCAVGAVITVVPSPIGVCNKAFRTLDDVAGGNIVSFNNAENTTIEDVILTMKQAAASLREPQP